MFHKIYKLMDFFKTNVSYLGKLYSGRNYINEEIIQQLKQVHHQIFMKHGNSICSDEEIVIDFDQTGLLANGKTYECTSKGYFPKKKN